MKANTIITTATELALTDLLTAAEGLFAVRPNMKQITVVRRAGGSAWVKVKGHWTTTAGQWQRIAALKRR
jgi:hypothetical protein